MYFVGPKSKIAQYAVWKRCKRNCIKCGLVASRWRVNKRFDKRLNAARGYSRRLKINET